MSQGDLLPSKVGQCPLPETGMPGTERAADTGHILRTCPATVKSGEGVLSRRGTSVSQRIVEAQAVRRAVLSVQQIDVDGPSLVGRKHVPHCVKLRDHLVIQVMGRKADKAVQHRLAGQVTLDREKRQAAKAALSAPNVDGKLLESQKLGKTLATRRGEGPIRQRLYLAQYGRCGAGARLDCLIGTGQVQDQPGENLIVTLVEMRAGQGMSIAIGVVRQLILPTPHKVPAHKSPVRALVIEQLLDRTIRPRRILAAIRPKAQVQLKGVGARRTPRTTVPVNKALVGQRDQLTQPRLAQTLPVKARPQQERTHGAAVAKQILVDAQPEKVDECLEATDISALQYRLTQTLLQSRANKQLSQQLH